MQDYENKQTIIIIIIIKRTRFISVSKLTARGPSGVASRYLET